MSVDRRRQILIAAGTLLAMPRFVRAQQAGRVYRIGFFSPASPDMLLTGLLAALRDLGYVEGRNIIVEKRYAEGKLERLPAIVAELIQLKVDLLLTGSTVSTLAAKRATTTIPIVFASVFDPVAVGLVQSLARPGGNITGMAIGVGGSGFGGKWLELLKDAIPTLSHVAVLLNSVNPANAPMVREVQAAARTLNVKLELLDAGNSATLDKAFAAIGTAGVQAVIVTNDPFFNTRSIQIAQFAAGKRLPAVHFSKRFVDDGGLMAYGASFEDSWRRAATFVDRILKGAKPADLPVEQPTKFELAINLKTAKALGLALPKPLLLRADLIVE